MVLLPCDLERSGPQLPTVDNLPADISNLPLWKQAAIQQARKLGGKG